MDRRTVLAAGGAIVTAALAGCSESDTPGRESGNPDGGSNNSTGSGDGSGNGGGSGGTEAVELLEHSWYNEGQFSAGVQGRLENVSGGQLSYVEVAVYFLDADEVRFSEGLANTTELAAGRVWEFDAMFTGEDPTRVDTYEIETSVDDY